MDTVDIKARIERLSQHPNSRRVFGAAHHRWQLTAPLSPEQVAPFEERHRVGLPRAYRHWLLEVGASGAGPGNGLFALGRWNLGGKSDRAWTAKQFGPLGTPFPYRIATEPHRGSLAGALPLCDFGCGIVGVLVTTGPEQGRIWIDHRRESADGGLVPEDGLDFDGWITAWLAEAERQASEHQPPPKQHVERPYEVLPVASIVPEAELVALRDRTLARVREKQFANIGRLGKFFFQGGRVQFSPSPTLWSAALKGSPLPAIAESALPEVTTLTKLFAALLAAPVFTEIEVPGLLIARLSQRESTSYRDYLGRTQQAGYGGRWLAFDTSSAKL